MSFADCPKCNAEYAVKQIKTGQIDEDQFECDCGFILKKWKGGATYIFRKIKDGTIPKD